MLHVLSLNPAMDWQYHTPTFTYGGLNRVACTYQGVGGKGINVAIALKNLGMNPHCVGINFTNGGEQVTAALDSHHIPHNFVNVPGKVRVNIKLYDDNKTMTELNQPGDCVPPSAIEALIAQVKGLPEGILILAGSLPQGCPPDIYTTLTRVYRGKVVLDAEGFALTHALKAP